MVAGGRGDNSGGEQMRGTVEVFIEYLCDAEKSENTRVSYRRDLMKLVEFLAERGVCEVSDIQPEHLQEYVNYLENLGFKAATVSRHIASVKAFYHFMCERKMVDEDVSECLTAPKVEKRSPEMMSDDEVESLLAQPDDATPKGMRDKAMLELLYATGLRVTELIRLQISDINLQSGYIVCRDGNKERMVAFGQEAMVALLKYLHMGRASLVGEKQCPEVFVNCSGQAMSRQGFWKIIKVYAGNAGIKTDITPHTFRHLYSRLHS